MSRATLYKIIFIKFYSKKKISTHIFLDERYESVEDPIAYLHIYNNNGIRTVACTIMGLEDVCLLYMLNKSWTYTSKIGLKVIGCIRMRLNYRNSSNFSQNSLWPSQLVIILSDLILIKTDSWRCVCIILILIFIRADFIRYVWIILILILIQADFIR